MLELVNAKSRNAKNQLVRTQRKCSHTLPHVPRGTFNILSKNLIFSFINKRRPCVELPRPSVGVLVCVLAVFICVAELSEQALKGLRVIA